MTPQDFRQARLRLGLTQEQLAILMGMRQEGIARIETTRAPTKIQAAFVRHLLECRGAAEQEGGGR